jgi:hypothetical protein
MKRSDFSGSYIIGLWLLALPIRTVPDSETAKPETSRFPREARIDMPGSLTTPG